MLSVNNDGLRAQATAVATTVTQSQFREVMGVLDQVLSEDTVKLLQFEVTEVKTARDRELFMEHVTNMFQQRDLHPSDWRLNNGCSAELTIRQYQRLLKETYDWLESVGPDFADEIVRKYVHDTYDEVLRFIKVCEDLKKNR